jgi:tetratricopeptide (TPR) repeat protein
MAEVSKRTKRIVGELAVLICLAYFWGVNSPNIDRSRVKAGVLNQVVRADRDNVDAYRFLADYHIRLGDNQKAVHALEQVVRIEPDDARAWMMLGDLRSDCGAHEDAMAAYQQAANLQTDNAQAHYQLGEVYVQLGERDLALEECQKLKRFDEQLANDLLDVVNGKPGRPKQP